MSLHIGSAPDSWGVWFPNDSRQTPWNRFLDEIAQAGYEWTELGPYGYLPTDPDRLRRELDQRGLSLCGSTAIAHLEDPEAWEGLETQIVGGGRLQQALGGGLLVLIDELYTDPFTGEQKRPAELDAAGWQRLIDTTHRAADVAADIGLHLVFHPHTDTHVEYEHQIERLLVETDPARVSLCLDTGHHAYRGGDPVAFLRKHHQRIRYLHLKSVDGTMRDRVLREGIPFATAVAQDVFCEPSQGIVDFPAFRDALQDVGYEGWITVEQDMYPAPFDKPLPIAKRTRAYLRQIGIG